MKILLGVFNVKVGKKNIFKPTIGNENLHQNSNDNGVRIISFATSKNLVVKNTVFPHLNIHKHTWTSPDGNTHNHIDHILIDTKWDSSILDVRNCRRADCDTDQYLVVAKVKKKNDSNKQEAKKFDREIFNLRRLNELEFRQQYQIEIAKSFAALENLSNDEDIRVSRAWESSKWNINTSATESLGLHELK